ncbi:MAG: T9SS type A sorting domain-containing protein [Bacteroidota bacterium]
MKRYVFLLWLCCSTSASFAQITITSTSMPVAGDTLRHCSADLSLAVIPLTDSGANMSWDYSALVPINQVLDSFLTPIQLNPAYILSIPSSDVGQRSNLPISGLPLPVSITDVYTFYKVQATPNSYSAVTMAANISGLPLSFAYGDPDEKYFFPLAFHNHDSSTFLLNMTVATLGTIIQSGYRLTTVDGWGTIVTPYYTSPVNCIRVRSEIHEIDSINSTLAGAPFSFPRNTVEYKWLVAGDHYPALFVTTNNAGLGSEQVTDVQYRDHYRPDVPYLGVNKATNTTITEIKAYPNPASNGTITFDIPSDWRNYKIEIFDIQSKLLSTYHNTRTLEIQSLSKGQYMARVTSGSSFAYVRIVR